MNEWNLDSLFTSFESKEFQKALQDIESYLQETEAFTKNELDKFDNPTETIKGYLMLSTKVRTIFLKCFAYGSLRMATNALDEEAGMNLNKLQQLSSRTTAFQTKFSKWLPKINDLDEIINNDEYLKQYEFNLNSIVKDSKFVLSDAEELVIAKLRQTGSTAWGQLQGLLTSTLEVDYDDKIITLSEVRNLAADKNQDIRKKAYEAELKAYEKIDKSVAFAINGVKGEVNQISEMRGYGSALEQAIKDSRLQKSTLDALISSMRDYLPHFHKYLKRKGELLGHENGLPWYDMFAPIGKSSKEFTIPEAMDYIFNNFKTFSDGLEGLAKRAYKEEWIDFLPKAGKRGGAFCFNLHPIKQSRIMTNFSGSFSSVITLAHELGHAYHGDQIFAEEILNSSYTMPVAETASTFCETIVKKAALKDADKDEKIFILEQSLKGSTQVIVDILSRFIFEGDVFDKRKKTPLNPRMLNEMMTKAQLEAYGDSLDPEFLHPYMWVNKSHYYRGGLSFYNFPYAFGLLFAKGIYAKFIEQGPEFVDKVNLLLRKTGQMTVEEVAKIVEIDVSSKEFWNSSLDVLVEEIEMFLELTK